MEEPNANRPQPIVFDVEAGGVSLVRATIAGSAAIITSRPRRAGAHD